MSAPATTTAPTIGFGAVFPQPRSASASARRIWIASSARVVSPALTSLVGEPRADGAVPPWIDDAAAGERVERVRIPAGRDLADLEHEPEERHVEPEIAEDVCPCHLL